MENKTKKLGLMALTALVISSSIGSGIFGIASDMAAGTSPGAAIAAWIITGMGVLMLCLALTNIIRKRPELSGIFSYATETFGPFGGFISGWGYWLSAWLGNIAFATIMMSALSYFFPALGDGSNLLSILIASLILWLMCFVVNRGLESAAILNTIITVCKLVPLFIFTVAALIAFKGRLFTADFWGTISGNFSLKEVLVQVKASMMVLMWVFVGIEGAAMMSDRAQSKKTAGKATVLGLIGLLCIYLLLSLLPYGLMERVEISQLKQPAMAYLLSSIVGPWGASFINIAMIISVTGCWLSWTMLPVETTLLMANQNLLPKKFGEVNNQNVPTFSLVFMTILSQIFIFTLLFTNKAYNFAYSLCTAAIFVTWIMVCIYQVKLSCERRKEKGEIWQLLIGILGTGFYGWAIWASGIGYFLMCMLVYVVGIFLYVKARKEYGVTKVFSKKELVVIGFIILFAVLSVFMLATGKIAV
ncbi:arginine-ornithine antiporter [Clostridium sp. HBUAS56010]|uniref:arginine-ornithine antiporter n=1 Tax=Clostridium sp. HBUAS56010 TaxID=2571127 RepID=UPI00117778DA|nr:arginine-ornithine antiporter [Clostridium sp. HBUAS56010]